MVEGDVRAEQLLVGELIHDLAHGRALEFHRDPEAERAGIGPLLFHRPGEHAQGHELVGRGEELLLQPRQVLRQLVIPIAGLRAAGGMDAADAAIEQRLDRRIGMRAAARIMRIVDHAGDAGIDAAERGDEIAGIHVVGPIGLGEGLMRRGGVGVQGRGIGVDAAELAFPGMAMAIDEAGDEDRVRTVDHLRAGRFEVAADGDDLLALDQQIALGDVAELLDPW